MALVFVDFLPAEASEQTLREAFATFGKVRDVTVEFASDGTRFGLVDMHSAVEAAKAAAALKSKMSPDGAGAVIAFAKIVGQLHRLAVNNLLVLPSSWENRISRSAENPF